MLINHWITQYTRVRPLEEIELQNDNQVGFDLADADPESMSSYMSHELL